ncbi:FkbM family methyltransferase [Flavobacterium sp. NG2]|uniref:FkbM family methyltransferase n=1 Tax=Flavobacterium sp. NG2 TaxID=3097547 RepID=UPI002A81C122|nr:FkbM family methyltransferase [Flavobacterium sp. NG2]WPR71618.1 FkbM family methyltransferase [Flavobacterium sp. NG2]
MIVAHDLLKCFERNSIDKRLLLEELSSSKLPLLIYGAGGYAKTLNIFLNEHNINISGVIVDKQYYFLPNKEWEVVYSFDEIDTKFDAYNIVIGFTDYLVAENNIIELKKKNKVYFLDTTLSVEFLDYKFIEDNLDAFYFSYQLLNDDVSKETFVGYLNGKLTLRCDGIYGLINKEQYFVKDIINLSENEVFIDAGAYNGDTLLKFINSVNGKYKEIICFEPDSNSYSKLTNRVKGDNIRNVRTINKGVWSGKKALRFNSNDCNAERSYLSESLGEIEVQCDSIDNVLNGQEATFIKMDIEGAEMEALKGAEETIKKYKPKLAICAYHKPTDLILIPQYIKLLNPDYKFYLRQHLHITQELVLYAI